MPVSALFFLDIKGRIVLYRDYRGDIPISCIEKFAKTLQASPAAAGKSSSAADDEDVADLSGLGVEADSSEVQLSDFSKPVFNIDGITYCYVTHSNLYVLGVTKRNTNAMAVFTFLHKTVSVLTSYFGSLEEESVRDNFVIVYELLDEMMDFGYPQFQEPKILQEYITQAAHKMDTSEVRPPLTVTNAVSWRSEGIRYKKNEVFLDVVEKLNFLVSANGTPVRSEVFGALQMRCYLTGMPELKLGLNDKALFEAMGRTVSRSKAVEMEDIKFHQCVRLSRFESDRTISFIPPDGEFELMSYRIAARVKPLIWVESVMEVHSQSRVEFLVKARAQFKPRSAATGIEITVPVPPDVATPDFKTAIGSAKYRPELDAFVWTISSLPGGSEVLMRAQFGLPSTVDAKRITTNKRPIAVKFEIPYFTVSGLQVRYLKIVEKSGYTALPWVRYITQSGDYSIRSAGDTIVVRDGSLK